MQAVRQLGRQAGRHARTHAGTQAGWLAGWQAGIQSVSRRQPDNQTVRQAAKKWGHQGQVTTVVHCDLTRTQYATYTFLVGCV
jgi:hypothetical protein